MKCFILILLTLLPITQRAKAQGWERIFESHDQQQGVSICQTLDGGYLALGVTHIGDNEEADMLFLKTNSEGNTEFIKQMNIPESGESPNSLIPLTDGGFIVAGSINVDGVWSGYLVRLDENADTLWTRAYGNTNHHYFRDVIATDDGGYLIAGEQDISLQSTGWCVKTDAFGQQEWEHYYGASSEQTYFREIKQSSGGYVVCGAKVESVTGGNKECLVMHLNSTGTVQWQTTFGTNEGDIANSLIVDDANIYVTSEWNDSVGVSKLNLAGSVIWSNSFVRGVGRRIIQTSDSNFMIAGQTGIPLSPDCYILKMDANGEEVWSRQRGWSDIERVYDVAEVEDGFVFVGMTDSYWFAYQMVYLLKTDIEGRLPNSLSTPFYEDEVNVKIGPCPFTSSLSVSVDQQSNKTYTVALYDLLGRQVAKNEISGGQAIIHRGQITAGTYSYVLIDESRIVSQGKVVAE